MTSSDWIAVFALLLSSFALALEVRRWFESGPRLHLSVIADAEEYPLDDGQSKLALIVINRGGSPTTLTHMVVFFSRPRWRMIRRRLDGEGLVDNPHIPAEIPVNGTWMASMIYTEMLLAARSRGNLYVGVFSAHRRRPFLIKVPPQRDEVEVPKDVIATGG